MYTVKPHSDWQVSGTSFLAPENLCFLCKLHVHSTQVSCSRKWLYALEKSALQSIVQSAAEFHDRNLLEIEHVLFVPVSGTSFLYQNGARNPIHTGKFSDARACNRNLRQKLASLNVALKLSHTVLSKGTHTQNVLLRQIYAFVPLYRSQIVMSSILCL